MLPHGRSDALQYLTYGLVEFGFAWVPRKNLRVDALKPFVYWHTRLQYPACQTNESLGSTKHRGDRQGKTANITLGEISP
ncbi:hypothetical protein MINT15_38610 [Saccharomonospora viridis]|uniref:Uncharacterized protein n=1 Tax=Saccharomonospora viridis TaxID=1852 RepID=A0A837D7E4_9PSEU|nr:hypothetical protein MINT15_38610 [Saccharomonospora viridis]